jgi:hypothetical protein
MGKVTRSKSVPKNMQGRYDQIVALTGEFCRQHLNEEYRELAQDMGAALCRKRPSPGTSGQPRSWACGIIYALGQVDFLSDKATPPYMTMTDVCAAFGVSPSTGGAKACTISDALKLRPFDSATGPRWTCGWRQKQHARSQSDGPTFVWMLAHKW